jgi:hypothetical protein
VFIPDNTAAPPAVSVVIPALGGRARIASNGVSSPTKNPVRRNTASAPSSRRGGTPASISASIEVETAIPPGDSLQ